MTKAILLVAVTVYAVALSLGDAGAQERDRRQLTDAQIRELIIQQSTDRYAGECACPYSLTADGRSCGKRSAYTRQGGSSLFCYARDVSDAMVRRYRNR